MIVRKGSKMHLEFDFSAAAKLFEEHAADKELKGEIITSPWHLYSVETLRQRHNLRTGEAFAVDVFVFGKGEPDDPSCTKVGGMPYWPSDQAWPTAPDGSPCHLLARFNFADSTDIVGADMPGAMLLLLTDSKEDWLWSEEGLSFHWAPVGVVGNPASSRELLKRDSLPGSRNFPPHIAIVSIRVSGHRPSHPRPISRRLASEGNLPCLPVLSHRFATLPVSACS